MLASCCSTAPHSRRRSSGSSPASAARAARTRKFSRDATFRGYHAQFSFYARAIKEAFGRAPRESFCVAVEPKKPFAITVLRLTESDLLEGEKSWRLWFERMLACESANHWPAYTEVIEPFEVARSDDVGLIIDGEKFNFDEE